MKLTRWSKAEIDAAPAVELDWLLKLDDTLAAAHAERARQASEQPR